MKTIFAYLEKIMKLTRIGSFPLENGTDKMHAKKVLKLLQEYADILEQIINSGHVRKYLNDLRNSNEPKLRIWADQILNMFLKVENVAKITKSTAIKLSTLQRYTSEQWQNELSNLGRELANSELYDGNVSIENLRAEGQVHEKELKRIISEVGHDDKLSQWNKIQKLSEEKRYLAEEKYFLKLIGRK